jgi:hypothetical protein
MSVSYCRECLAEIPWSARDGRCSQCRPPRSHSRPGRRQPWRAVADDNFNRLIDQQTQPTEENR